MPNVRDTILIAYAMNLIDVKECMLLYDINTPKNPDIPYWRYEPFDLDQMTMMNARPSSGFTETMYTN